MTTLHKAAQAVVDRWDSPLWKDQPNTGEFIQALREALSQPDPVLAEREACAALCTSLQVPSGVPLESRSWWAVGIVDCAVAIDRRSRA